MKKTTIWSFSIKGAGVALVSAIIGSIFFIIFDFICIAIISPSISFIDLREFLIPSGEGLMIFGAITGAIIIFACLPSVLGGIILANLLLTDSRKGRLSSRRGMIEGGLLGGGAALVVSFLILAFLAFYSHRFLDFGVIILHISCAVMTATLAGICVGRILSISLLNIHESENI